MPEFTPPTPPRTHFDLNVDYFIKAAKGEPFNQSVSFYKRTGKEIKEEGLFNNINYFFEDNQEYIVVEKTKLKLSQGDEELLLKEIGKESNKLAFIFYKCLLPGIHLMKCVTAEWFFINTHINGDLSITANSQVGDICVWKNSKIEDINIKNSQCKDIRLDENSQSNSIRVRSHSQTGNLKIANNSKFGPIRIEGSSKTENIEIYSSNQDGYILIANFSTVRQILIAQDSRIGNLSIIIKSKSEGIWISKSLIGAIELSDYSQSADISISENSNSGYINIEKNSQIGVIRIYNSQTNQIRAKDNYCNVYLYNSTVPLLRFTDCFLNEMVWEAGTKGELYIDGGSINHLKLEKTALLKDAVFSAINTHIYIVQLQELLVQGQLILRNIKPATTPFEWNPSIKKHIEDNVPGDNSSELEKAIYKSKIELLQRLKNGYEEKIVNLKSKFEKSTMPLFRIVDSSLSRTEITGSDLRKFTFEYCDSKILETFITGTQLPKDEIEIHNPTNEELDAIKVQEQKTAFYNQLKRIFENQGNIVEATQCHSRAMISQELYLKYKRREKENKSFRKKGSEWIELRTFQLNRLSNKHGESWPRALVFTIIIGFLFFYFTVISLKYQFDWNLIWSGKGWQFISDGSLLSENMRKLPGYFLPTHSMDYFTKETSYTPGFCHYFWDFWGRVVIGYGIFQFIAAFRRHGRRGG